MYRREALKSFAAVAAGIGVTEAEILEVKDTDIALMLKTPTPMSREAIENVKAAWSAAWKGPGREIPIFVLDKDCELSVVRREDVDG